MKVESPSESSTSSGYMEWRDYSREQSPGTGSYQYHNGTWRGYTASHDAEGFEEDAYAQYSATHQVATVMERNQASFLDLQELKELVAYQRELCSLRERTLIERIRLREQRRALRGSRENARKAALGCVEAVKAVLTLRSDSDTRMLNELYERSKASYDVLGATGADYDEVEDAFADMEEKYNSEEWEFNRREAVFYDQVQNIISGRPVTPSARSTSNYSTEVTPVRNNEHTNWEDPEVTQYRSFKGQVDMLREARENLSTELLEILDEKRAHESRGQQLHPQNQKFLDDYNDLYDEASQKIRDAENQVEMQRQRLFNTRNRRKARSRRASDAQVDRDVDTPAATLMGIEPQELSTVTGPAMSASQSDGGLISLRRHFAVLRQRISDWIFDNMQSTRLEKVRHKDILNRLNKEELSDEKWWNLVREYWNKGMHWDQDLIKRFSTLRDSLTEYVEDDSNTKNLSAASVPVLVLDGQTSSLEGSEGLSTHLVWPLPEEYPLEGVDHSPVLPLTPPQWDQGFKLLRRLNSTSEIRSTSTLAKSMENDSFRKSWPG